MRLVLAILGTVAFGLASAPGAAFAMPPEEPADPVCEAGVQATVYDDQGVAHVACVLSEAPPIAASESTTTVAGVGGAGALPKTGRGADAALLGAGLLLSGLICCGAARRVRQPKAFRARRLTP